MAKSHVTAVKPLAYDKTSCSRSTELYWIGPIVRALHGEYTACDHLILLSVLKRIHCGMGLFCLAFLASFLLMRNVFWDGCMVA